VVPQFMNKANQINKSFQPEHVLAVRNLNLRAKLIVEGMIAGIHRSPYHGFSAEFSEYRNYQLGETTRYIDWRKYAKTDKTLVKLFEDETNLYAHILLDKSASMGFGSEKSKTKFEYAKTLAAALAWLLIRQRDAVGLSLFDTTIHNHISPRSTMIQLKNIINTLDTSHPSNITSSGDAIHWLAGMIKKRGLCIIISDLLDNPQRLIDGLRHLRYKKQDIIVLWILDPMELAFSEASALELIDAETNQRMKLDGGVASQMYREKFYEHGEILCDTCRDMFIDFHRISITEPFQKVLHKIAGKRRRMH